MYLICRLNEDCNLSPRCFVTGFKIDISVTKTIINHIKEHVW